jgi:uncharacterized surface protein with fasciclin (FAS1) repeats
MKLRKQFAMLFATATLSLSAMAQQKDVVDVATSSNVHTTLVTAIKAANLVETLKGSGPFTVFAPTNDAFAKLPAGTLDALLKPEAKAQLAGLLTYHVVAGAVDSKALLAAIKTGNGSTVLSTVAGGKLTASIENGKIVLTDESGGKSTVTCVDIKASNGIIHVIDAVVLPKG